MSSPDEENADSVLVPYHETPEVSVWAVDDALQMFTNLSEENAALLAEMHSHHIYFFAELTMETDRETYIRYLGEELNKPGGI